MNPHRERADVLAALAELSRLRPDWRLGQMLANLAMTAGRMELSGVWDLGDDEALDAARTLIKEYSEFGPSADSELLGTSTGREPAG